RTSLLPALLLLSSVLWCDSAGDSVPTYQRKDPSTGGTLTCAKCPPGTHMVAHCTATTATQCAPCRDDHFTELWNYLPRCLYCNIFCSENQEVETECSARHNRVCRCKEGFYWSNAFCDRHAECGPGFGVQTKGTPKTNTVCEQCAEGYFSASTSALDSCVNHQECALGQVAFLNGSMYHDTVCGTSEDFAKGGELYRMFLSGFFSMHRMRLAKMKKFIRRPRAPKQRGPLMDQIKTWLSEAPVEQLKKLPHMLKATQLNSMAEKLEKALHEIQQQDPSAPSD
uniref:TNFR-Cys domain-containing protein n=1 Tax=Mola mola TaxID=94237 RepID=A0A3Q4B1H3_MOLML